MASLYGICPETFILIVFNGVKPSRYLTISGDFDKLVLPVHVYETVLAHTVYFKYWRYVCQFKVLVRHACFKKQWSQNCCKNDCRYKQKTGHGKSAPFEANPCIAPEALRFKVLVFIFYFITFDRLPHFSRYFIFSFHCNPPIRPV